jgi:hypothetical protein
MRQKFTSADGRVLFLQVEEVKYNYPENTLKLEATFYPVGSGSYSSFIYTLVSLSEIEQKMELIAQEFIGEKRNSFSSGEISQILTKHIEAIFPQK